MGLPHTVSMIEEMYRNRSWGRGSARGWRYSGSVGRRRSHPPPSRSPVIGNDSLYRN